MDTSNNDMTILVVDDTSMVLRFAAHVLSGLGARLITAVNGAEALEVMEREAVDLLVTDLMMPELDGFELISRLKTDSRFEQTHIIVMTALDQTRDKVRALELGANDYTVKPLDAMEFQARVKSGLREMRLKRELDAAWQSLDREMRQVADLQQRLLPRRLPQGDRFAAAGWYRPWSRAGGDYYDCFFDGQGRLIASVADVSGHGASAAVLMGVFRALLKLAVAEGGSAADMIGRINEALLDNIGSDPDFITAFLAVIDVDAGRINYCAAGHGDMMAVPASGGAPVRLPAGGTVLGCFSGVWSEGWLDLGPGGSLVMYTDGLVEAADGRGEEFGRARLAAILAETSPGAGPEDLIGVIRQRVEEFTAGTELPDDVTLLVLQFK